MLQALRGWGIEVLVRDLVCWWHIRVALPFKCKGRDSGAGVGARTEEGDSERIVRPCHHPNSGKAMAMRGMVLLTSTHKIGLS